MYLEIAMQWNDAYDERLYTFANNINTQEGGTHLVGCKSPLARPSTVTLSVNAPGRTREDALTGMTREAGGRRSGDKAPTPS